jgi:imidazolonepropionase-like amidohydrolase
VNRLYCFVCAAVLALGVSDGLLAQNLVITNARVIDGNGGVTPDGSVVVQNGTIVSVTAGEADAPDGALLIDAEGRTLMPGFIDAHRHIIQGQEQQWLAEQAADRMREFLEAGFTSVQSAGGNPAGQVELKRRINEGEIDGPRIVVATFLQVAGPAPAPPAAGRGGGRGGRGGGGRGGDPARTDTARPGFRPTATASALPEEQIRASVRSAAAAGVEAMKVIFLVTPNGPEEAGLAILADESEKLGLRSITHATSVEDTLAAVRAGTDVLMHTPHTDLLTLEQAQFIADSGIPMVSTLGVFTPTFAEDNQAVRDSIGYDNEPRFRDLLPYPETAEPWYSAGQGGVNARLFWNAGGIYAFGTDTTYLPKDTLKQELTALNAMFSRRDIVQILTKNAAIAIGRGEDLGTLEPGKLADMVLIDGNPLAEMYDLLKVVLVVRDGRIVIDKL